MFIRKVIGEITLDMGPGAEIWIAAGSCPGMVVLVNVGCGVGLRVGLGVLVGGKLGVRASATSVPSAFAASAVWAITVGRYSGGYAVGMGLAVGAAQAASSRSRAARRGIRFMRYRVYRYIGRQVNVDAAMHLSTCLPTPPAITIF
jgi:hypothetical protein